MPMTNIKNWPEPVVNKIREMKEAHDKNKTWDFSVTELIDSPQIPRLLKAHGPSFNDVSQNMYALLGTLTHQLLEGADTQVGAIQEKRLEIPIAVDGRLYRISGGFDRVLLEDRVLQDYKLMSIWEFIYGLKPEREAQCNVYRYLCEMHDITVDALEIVGIFRNWEMRDWLKRPEEYPNELEIIKVPIWTLSETEDYIKHRIRLHRDKESTCSEEEMWTQPAKWAVKVKNLKRAIKVYDSKEEATEAVSEPPGWIQARAKGRELIIEYRPGARRRCEDRGDGRSYCPVSNVCPQHKFLEKAESQHLQWRQSLNLKGKKEVEVHE